MTILLDTNILSELRLPSPDPRVAAWFAAIEADEIAIASFTVTEIEYGIARLPAGQADFAARLTRWLDAIMASHRILAMDAEAGRILGRMLADPGLRNMAVAHPHAARPQFAGDLVIAATALAHGASVATRNAQDFSLIASRFPPLTGIDPFTGRDF